MKKAIKIIGVILFVVVLIAAGVAIWQWDTISIIFGNKNISGPVGAVPEPAIQQELPLTKGEADWICWRGSRGDGRSGVTGISTDWSGGLQKKWQVDFLCRGRVSATWSAPVVQGNRLVVCGRDETGDLVFCLSPEDGSLIWKSSYPAEAKSNYGTGSRATPWIDDDRVYTFGRSGDLVCWNLLNGSKLWHKNVNDEGGEAPTWGHSTSPLVTDTLVIVNGGGTARTIAYDKKTGAVEWKSGGGQAGYAAISRMQIEDVPALLIFHGKGLAALVLADGKEMWNVPWETNYDVHATTPLVSGDRVFITSGYGTGGELLKVDKSKAEVVWKSEVIASHHSDLFIINGFIYGYSGDSMQNKGVFKCVELDTGVEKWSTKEMGWGTCVYVDGFLLCSDIKGNIFLMKPDPEKFVKVTGMSRSLGKVRGAAWTVPVLANGNLFLRFKQSLLCYGISQKPTRVGGLLLLNN
ncbi:MAG: PQQ-like beta-propeller repeat protein [Candidatus Aminicenantes bacterium]|nr:PQQ-like beta-propeller repeat protein [Candidatus Aminicenantes bacterium]